MLGFQISQGVPVAFADRGEVSGAHFSGLLVVVSTILIGGLAITFFGPHRGIGKNLST